MQFKTKFRILGWGLIFFICLTTILFLKALCKEINESFNRQAYSEIRMDEAEAQLQHNLIERNIKIETEFSTEQSVNEDTVKENVNPYLDIKLAKEDIERLYFKKDSLMHLLTHMGINVINSTSDPKPQSYILEEEAGYLILHEDNTLQDDYNCYYRAHEKCVKRLSTVAKSEGFTTSQKLLNYIHDNNLFRVDDSFCSTCGTCYAIDWQMEWVCIGDNIDEDTKIAYLYHLYRILVGNPIEKNGLRSMEEFKEYQKLHQKFN